jgi:hypothetical protein
MNGRMDGYEEREGGSQRKKRKTSLPIHIFYYKHHSE